MPGASRHLEDPRNGSEIEAEAEAEDPDGAAARGPEPCIDMRFAPGRPGAAGMTPDGAGSGPSARRRASGARAFPAVAGGVGSFPREGPCMPIAEEAALPAPQCPENAAIAGRMRDFADLLAAQGEDGFRVRAYRAAAARIDRLDRSLCAIHDEGGAAALIALPAIGRGIAAAIVEILTTGRWTQLDRLRGEVTPERLFVTLPGVGPRLAARFAGELGVETLEDLEAALHDPRQGVRGLGARRRDALRAVLADRLGSLRRDRAAGTGEPEAPVSLLLEADAIYRRKAEAGDLRRIAPRRMNPTGAAWLPVLHLRRGDWHLTALYSNTARAHRLGATRDWVVLFHHLGDGPERRATVVTARGGPLRGRRVVRGREEDCAAHYAVADGVS